MKKQTHYPLRAKVTPYYREATNDSGNDKNSTQLIVGITVGMLVITVTLGIFTTKSVANRDNTDWTENDTYISTVQDITTAENFHSAVMMGNTNTAHPNIINTPINDCSCGNNTVATNTLNGTHASDDDSYTLIADEHSDSYATISNTTGNPTYSITDDHTYATVLGIEDEHIFINESYANNTIMAANPAYGTYDNCTNAATSGVEEEHIMVNNPAYGPHARTDDHAYATISGVEDKHTTP